MRLRAASSDGGIPDDLLLTGLARYLDRAQRPAAIGIPRTRMDLPFAVCLMRSSYNAADELDFVPMDVFQKSFFLFRQEEWQAYKDEHPLTMQGDLSDPVYFDFISFAQYYVINNFLRHPRTDFVEVQNAAADNVYVRRNKMFENDAVLPGLFGHAVGEKVVDFIYSKYPQGVLPDNKTTLVTNPTTGATYISDTDLDAIVGSSQLLLDVFEINSFAVDIRAAKSARAVSGAEGRFFTVSLTAPANLWSLSYLTGRKEAVTNNFVAMVLRYYFRANHGIKLDVVNVVFYDKIRCLMEFRVRPFDFRRSTSDEDVAIGSYMGGGGNDL